MSPSATRDDSLDVIDIRSGEIQTSLLDEINRGLRPQLGEGKQLPTMLLYDAKGLALFEEITYLDEYYLTNAEIEVLERHCDQIASLIPRGAQIVELGSGNLRKVGILLKALERAEKDVNYYALDLSLSELYRTLAEVEAFQHIRCHGLHGTYHDGLEWLKRPENQGSSKCIMFLGSSIGNFERSEDAAFLKDIGNVLGPDDSLIIGIDGCQNRDKIFAAYNDRHGVTHEFYRNGLRHANKLLGKELFNQDEWDIIGDYDSVNGRHQASISPRYDMDVEGFHFTKGERIHFENSHKYSCTQRARLWLKGGFQVSASFADQKGEYFLNMLSVSKIAFPLTPADYARSPVPSLEEFKQLWAAWDVVTLQMIPGDELLSKPINLRHCCMFYLGHIPTFLDMQITRAIGSPPTEPITYAQIFERGIDPDVENPSLCHAHSEIPDQWPPVEEIASFQARVRERTAKLYEDRSAENGKVGRALWLAFEHESMHLETLLYMLLQSDWTLPPPGPKPDFEALAKQTQANSTSNEWIRIPQRQLTIGLDDPDMGDRINRYLGWDNEKPPRTISVSSFEARAHPITNGDYARYLEECKIDKFPTSWTSNPTSMLQNEISANKVDAISRALMQSFLNDKAVRTVYGPIPFQYAIDWPVMASYDELAGCARWMNGRVPTLEEARSLYSYADELDTTVASSVCARTIPAVNGHLSNDGVEETPPSCHSHEQSSGTKEQDKLDPNVLFKDLSDCNVGFKNFHPVPVTQNGDKLAGLSGLGGVWEWTSSVLERHEGFEPMELYPAYTSDFFDGKHHVVLGGSWATHPRIAGRKTFVNWYQRNYPYAWVGARVVRDI